MNKGTIIYVHWSGHSVLLFIPFELFVEHLLEAEKTYDS